MDDPEMYRLELRTGIMSVINPVHLYVGGSGSSREEESEGEEEWMEEISIGEDKEWEDSEEEGSGEEDWKEEEGSTGEEKECMDEEEEEEEEKKKGSQEEEEEEEEEREKKGSTEEEKEKSTGERNEWEDEDEELENEKDGNMKKDVIRIAEETLAMIEKMSKSDSECDKYKIMSSNNEWRRMRRVRSDDEAVKSERQERKMMEKRENSRNKRSEEEVMFMFKPRQEETRYLQTEVRRLEDMLASSRAEQDTVSVRYNALSDHVADEWQEYQKRLEYFNEVHRKQTTLIDRLANKVREYRGRCRELEMRSTETTRLRETTERDLETLNMALSTAEERLRASEAQHTFDLETALVKLEDEQTRCEAYESQVSSMQEQVGRLETTVAGLKDERDKAQTALKRLTDEVKAKEEQWASESQSLLKVVEVQCRGVSEYGPCGDSAGAVVASGLTYMPTLTG
ncbi:Rootletin [Portunus trituberculatus]|uniref:Rootletin n=1 Tax=Portunus trituberculatus TaxID=210409 RepID=A0A5B7EZA2_PORTR|nr:Rootletin [Portunus trituberculatus]